MKNLLTLLIVSLTTAGYAVDFPSPLTVDGRRAWHADGVLADYNWPKERELDLNGDGKPELFLATVGYSRGRDYALFSPSDGGWKLLAEGIPGGQHDFELLPEESNGFHYFKATQPSGLGDGVVENIYAWDGTRYASLSPPNQATSDNPTPPTPEEKTATEKMLREENLGGLRLEMAEKQVIKLVGKPKKQGKLEMWEAIGSYMQEWSYPDKGLELQMTTGVKKTGPREVFMITAKKGCKLATKGGIKIGSTEEEVRKIYGPFEDKENPPQGEGQFVAGSLYGGIIFDFKDGKVSRIFFGAAAE